MIAQMLAKVYGGQDLTADEAESVMDQIMSGDFEPAQFGAFVTALGMKGETADEVAGMARAMRRAALGLEVAGEDYIDTCGTGGDGKNTFNVSTAAALIAAAGGVVVTKHGNRAASSRSGSADVLEALGARIDLTPPTGRRLHRPGRDRVPVRPVVFIRRCATRARCAPRSGSRRCSTSWAR